MRLRNLLPVLNLCLAILLIVLTGTNCAWAGGEKVLYQFPYGPDGGGPGAALVLDTAGNLYGTAPYGGVHGAGIVFKLTPTGNGWTSSVLYAFSGGADGGTPQAGLVFDSAGNLYGTTSCGGDVLVFSPFCEQGLGTVFELTPQSGGSWAESILYTFTGAADGGYPVASLIFDAASNLYGTTEFGGTVPMCNCGVAFELTPGSGGSWIENVIHAFSNDNGGYNPTSGLVFDKTGNLYGTTRSNSQSGLGGIVFELTPGSNDWTETVIYTLPDASLCCFPGPNMIIDAAGNLYGASVGGGSASLGMVFRLSPRPGGLWTETTLHSFLGGRDGQDPAGSLIFDPAGNLYGTTYFGGGRGCQNFGFDGCGTVFELSPNSSGGVKETVLHRFDGNYDGCCLQAGLARDPAGNLYGTTASGGGGNLGTVFKLAPRSGGTWTGSLLHTFRVAQHGGVPFADLVSDSFGNLYGTTQTGGTYDYGTVFEFDTNGEQTVLYSFAGDSDGRNPYAGLVFDSAGNLYGTTFYGGSVTACGGSGCGSVFELSPTSGGVWKETIIHAFNGTDGNNPHAGLVFDQSGNLYGTTANGGSDGGGTVFELTAGQNGSWTENILVGLDDSYCNGPTQPLGGVVLDKVGNIYGTASAGGSVDNCDGGAVFKLTRGSNGQWTLSVLHSFVGTDGSNPQAGVILDQNGNIYGTTAYGGTSTCGCGTVFKVDDAGQQTTLYNFTGGNDGAFPFSILVADLQGRLYGTTERGGGKGQCASSQFCGTIFEMTPVAGGLWNERILHTFSGPDGGNPLAGVLLDPVGGRLFGTTIGGGVGLGVVFEISR
jgi:uncharacterized repeat protein (TIGR03803 family)